MDLFLWFRGQVANGINSATSGKELRLREALMPFLKTVPEKGTAGRKSVRICEPDPAPTPEY